MKTFRILMLVMLAASFTAVQAQKKVNPVGTWSYEAPYAPYEYSEGEVVVSKEGKDYKVEIKLGEYYSIKASSVEYNDNVLSYKLYVEGESVSIKTTMGKEEFKGTASYSEGTIDITGKKKKA
jgi:hypothetical protein